LLQKAQAFARDFGYANDTISIGWIDRWKIRHDVSSKKMCGESANVSDSSLSEWKRNRLPEILRQFQQNDVFNADETVIFWKVLPERTLAFKGESVKGRLTTVIFFMG